MNGYQIDFLGKDFIVDYPLLAEELSNFIAPVKNSKDNILRYLNYSLIQHSERRFPIYTVSNIDGSQFQAIPRKGLFKHGDRWIKDRRIAYKHQWGRELYSADRSDFDRGHLTKREDVQWGKNVEDVKEAARKTFYYTNSVPQRKEVNRSIWLNIENYILHDEASSHDLKVNVFTGAVLDVNDPLFVTEVREESIKIPTLFWKVIYYINQDNILSRVAFLVGQKHILEREEIVFKSRTVSKENDFFNDFEQAETYQVEVGLIEELTKITFADAQDTFNDDRPSQLILEEVNVRGIDNANKQYILNGLAI